MKYNIDEFIELVNAHNFVDAHEVLEDDWNMLKKLEDKKSAKFLQALINGATALALYVKNRPDGCIKVWGALQRNKHLINEISLEEKEKYVYTINLLEDLYKNKESKIETN